MIFRSLHKKDNIKNIRQIEIVLLLQFGIDIRDFPTDAPKCNSNDFIDSIIDYCDEKLKILSNNNHFFVGNEFNSTNVLKRSAIFSVYNTVCALLDDKSTLPLETIRNDFDPTKEELSKLRIGITDSGKNTRISSKFFSNNNTYLYDSIVPLEDEMPKKKDDETVKKQLYKFGAHASMLLMWKYNSFNIIDTLKENPKPLSVKELKNIINRYLKPIDVIKNAIGRNGANINYGAHKPQYLNDYAVLETVTNAKLLRSILTILCYLIYNGHDLSSSILKIFMKSLEIPGIFCRDYWLYKIIEIFEFIENKEEFKYEGLHIIENFKNADKLGTILYNEKKPYEMQYLEWQRDFNIIINYVTKILIPIYENTLFLLIYKALNNSECTDDMKILKIMKNKIEEYIMIKKDNVSIFDYGIYNCNNTLKPYFYTEFVEMGGCSNRYKLSENSEKINWEYIYDKINWHKNSSNLVLIQQFIFDFFKYMREHKKQGAYLYDYTVTYDSFSINKLLGKHSGNVSYSDANMFNSLRGQLIYTNIQQSINDYKIDDQK